MLSDSHLETDEGVDGVLDMLPDKPVDVFLLAGDITKAQWCQKLCMLVHEALGCPVIFVPGNHEYYYTGMLGKTMFEVEKMWEDEFRDLKDIHYLQNTSVTIDGVSFFGSTWWTNFELANVKEKEIEFYPHAIADFRYIKTRYETKGERDKRLKGVFEASDMDESTLLLLHGRTLSKKMLPITMSEMAYLNEAAAREYRQWHQKTQGKRVLVSHFPMLDSLCHPRYAPNAYFVSEDRATIEEYPPDLLVYGHTHYNIDTDDAGTRCRSNMYGYQSEAGYTGYDKNKVIEI